MCILNNLAIRKHLRYRQEIKRTFVIPIIASAIMGVVSKLLYQVIYTALGESTIAMVTGLVVTVMIAVVIYFAALLAMRGLREKELRAFPKGHLLVKVAKKLHFRL